MGTLGKKRTYRELENWDLDDNKYLQRASTTSEEKAVTRSNYHKKGVILDMSDCDRDAEIKSLRFNQTLLQKASAAVDLIS